jgi:hypothetical protein
MGSYSARQRAAQLAATTQPPKKDRPKPKPDPLDIVFCSFDADREFVAKACGMGYGGVAVPGRRRKYTYTPDDAPEGEDLTVTEVATELHVSFEYSRDRRGYLPPGVVAAAAQQGYRERATQLSLRRSVGIVNASDTEG